ncbi:hypothetical protein [Amycolatopsis sp. FDAARGOS 1241]|uniref:hypothetical protein n=1 Tax=Amycolatopsis sp. FDAARGOS 1241 TaxID=2778070 RepID=UPI001950F8EC|nr:hypothetical protein [Amycolatopsis sp. FDAARGOS 1241]QRP49041.1 hypothetical protein I6J71_15315 [Amycolatopsis sp. FDAARGOS 1241]
MQLAGLPIGVAQGESGTMECLSVSWLGNPAIPDGVEVVVTTISVGPSDVVSGSEGCGEKPACTSFTFTAEALPCSVGITWVDQSRKGSLSMNGRLTCGGDQSTCEKFASQTKTGQHVNIDPPEREISPKTTKSSSPKTTESSAETSKTTTETTITSTTSG